MASQTWINGRFHDKLTAAVSLFDHGFLHGDGVWEGLRVHAGHIRRLDQHLAQLSAAATACGLTIPYGPEQLAAIVRETLTTNDRTAGYVRIIVTRGPGTLGLDPRKCEPTVIVIAEEVGIYPRELATCGLDLIVREINRPDPAVSTLSRMPFVIAKAAALQAGCFDALLFDSADRLYGATESAVLVVKEGVVSASPGGPEPVECEAALAFLEAAGTPIRREYVAKIDVLTADELLLVGAAGGLMPIRSLDGAPVRQCPGRMFQLLRADFAQ